MAEHDFLLRQAAGFLHGGLLVQPRKMCSRKRLVSVAETATVTKRGTCRATGVRDPRCSSRVNSDFRILGSLLQSQQPMRGHPRTSNHMLRCGKQASTLPAMRPCRSPFGLASSRRLWANAARSEAADKRPRYQARSRIPHRASRARIPPRRVPRRQTGRTSRQTPRNPSSMSVQRSVNRRKWFRLHTVPQRLPAHSARSSG